VSERVSIRSLVRYTLERIAPDELIVIDAMADLTDDEIDDALQKRRKSPETVGFGADAALALITPILWEATKESLRVLYGMGLEHATEGIFKKIRRKPKTPEVNEAIGGLAEASEATEDRIVDAMGSLEKRLVELGLTQTDADTISGLVGQCLRDPATIEAQTH
jgi:hypothetical protein